MNKNIVWPKAFSPPTEPRTVNQIRKLIPVFPLKLYKQTMLTVNRKTFPPEADLSPTDSGDCKCNNYSITEFWEFPGFDAIILIPGNFWIPKKMI
jgi:hypothetical protein